MTTTLQKNQTPSHQKNTQELKSIEFKRRICDTLYEFAELLWIYVEINNHGYIILIWKWLRPGKCATEKKESSFLKMCADPCYCFRKQVNEEGASLDCSLRRCPAVYNSQKEHQKSISFEDLIVIVSVYASTEPGPANSIGVYSAHKQIGISLAQRLHLHNTQPQLL